MKKRAIAIVSCSAVFAVCMSGVFVNNLVAKANTKSLFYTDGVELSTHQQLPIDKITGDSRYGLLMTADNDGENVTYVSNVMGKFEMDFAVFSQDSFSGNPTDAVYNNLYADIQELSVCFNDLNDAENSFEVVLSAGYAGNVVTPTARIRARGQEAGIYNSGRNYSQQTAAYNAMGLYTAIEGASFSNRAYVLDSLTSDVKSIVLSFDPETMSVYARASNGSNVLVWNFLNEINDTKDIGFTLNKMENYSVSIVFDDIVDGREANLLVYSVNGRDTSWHYLGNDEKVGMTADIDVNGAVGEEYSIPYPNVSENFQRGTVTVVGPISSETFTLEKDMSFTPSFAGNYSIIYNLISKQGVKSSVEHSIEVLDNIPPYNFTVSSILMEENYGVGSNILLPEVWVEGGLLKRKANAILTVTRNGSVLDGYDKCLDYEKSFVFAGAGEYRFVFASLDERATQEYVVQIDESLPTFESLDFPYEVALGETFVVPQWRISKNGANCNYRVITQKPSGLEVIGEELLVDELGVYTVTYQISYDNKTVEYQRCFNARHLSTDMFVSESSKIQANVGMAWFNNKHNGLLLSKSSIFTVDYTKEIDLSDNTKDDLLLEFVVIPDEVGVENYQELTFTFTDVEDEANAFKISVLSGVPSGNSKSFVYIKANAPNQIPSGWLDSSKSRLFVAGQNGTFNRFSFSGTYSLAETPPDQSLRLYYDNESKAVYSAAANNEKVEIVDFDDTACFSNLWRGLTSGKVKLSISTARYISGNVTLLMKSIDGLNLASEYVVEEEKPFIFLDMQGYKETALPYAVVGKEYDLFTARAYSKLQGTLDISKRVYLNYGESTQEEIDITNGFIPQKTGTYTVVYQTVDGYGTINTKVISLQCKFASSYSEIVSNISNENDKSLYVGQKDCILPINCEGGSGKLSTKIEIKNVNGENVAFDRNGEFVLEKEGEYIVSYVVTDFLGTEKTFSYTIDCSISKKPIVNEEVSMPNGFIAGFTYELPELVGYDYSVNGSKRKAQNTIVIYDENGEEILCEVGVDKLFTPIVEYGNVVTVRYLVGGANGYLVKDYKVAIKDAVDLEKQEVDKRELFVTENVNSVNAKATHIEFALNGDAKISFVNNLTENKVNFRFGAIMQENAKFEYVTVYLTDAKDANVQVRFDISFNGEKAYLYNNGDRNIKVELAGGKIEDIIEYAFVYNSALYSLCDGNNATLFIFEQTTQGDVFEGFPSGQVNIEFEIKGVVGKSKMFISEIGKFAMNSEINDIAPPTITFKDDIVGVAHQTELVTLPAGIVSDVVSPVCSLTVTVTLNGKAVLDVNGTPIKSLDATTAHQFIAEKTGNYSVVYTYSDEFGNSNTYKKSLKVYETKAPELTVNGDLPASVKVGKTIKIPTYTVSDNATIAEKMISVVYVISPNGLFEKVEGSYTFTRKGTYTVRYVAYDEFYNYVMIDYTIEVA